MPTEPTDPRTLDLRSLLARKSHFLLGPRQTGKTFLIRKSLGDVRVYNLLDSATFLALSRNPGLIAQEIGDEKMVVVDEIQRLPELLNEIHRLVGIRAECGTAPRRGRGERG
jgi:predicted AAA+ superfamily ATPase